MSASNLSFPTVAATPQNARSLAAWATSASIVLADLVALSVVYWFAVVARNAISPISIRLYLYAFNGVLLVQCAFVMQDLYPGLLIHPVEEIRRVFYALTTVFLVFGFVAFLFRNSEPFSRSIFIATWAVSIPSVLLARSLMRNLLSRREWWGTPAVVLGSGPAARRVAAALRKRNHGLKVIGVLVPDDISEYDTDRFGDIIGSIQCAPELAASRMAELAIVAMPELSHKEIARVIQAYCRGFRRILLMPDILYACSLGVSARDVDGELGIEVPQRLFQKSSVFLKRALDLVGTIAGIAILAPLLTLIAACVKCSSRGPVLYRHARHGRNGELFNALKFRTMVTNGEEVLDRYFIEHPEQLVVWNTQHKLKNDPRITTVGKWLRRLSLDELPQLFNVLTGEMSLVGPRPIVPNELTHYADSFDFCTSVKPGVTGMWQVSGRNDLDFGERIRFNEFYIQNWSIWLDIYILCRTVKVVATAEGAY